MAANMEASFDALISVVDDELNKIHHPVGLEMGANAVQGKRNRKPSQKVMESQEATKKPGPPAKPAARAKGHNGSRHSGASEERVSPNSSVHPEVFVDGRQQNGSPANTVDANTASANTVDATEPQQPEQLLQANVNNVAAWNAMALPQQQQQQQQPQPQQQPVKVDAPVATSTVEDDPMKYMMPVAQPFTMNAFFYPPPFPSQMPAQHQFSFQPLQTLQPMQMNAQASAFGYPQAMLPSPQPVQHQVEMYTAQQPPAKKPRLTGFAAKHGGTSNYRGVSWHTQTGRWKAQIKVNGKDINLGRHKSEEAAARAYDRAAICARGVKEAKLNFAEDEYKEELEYLANTPLDTLAATLRGVEERMQAQTSRFHGVRLNKRTKKWEAYIRVAGKHVHLGCHDTEVAAAQAFDQAAIVRHAHNLGAMGGKPQLVTNFPPEYYQELLKQLMAGNPHPTSMVQQAAFERGMQPGSLTAALQEAVNSALPPLNSEGQHFYQLDEKYVQNLLEKCRQQGGSLQTGPGVSTAIV